MKLTHDRRPLNADILNAYIYGFCYTYFKEVYVRNTIVNLFYAWVVFLFCFFTYIYMQWYIFMCILCKNVFVESHLYINHKKHLWISRPISEFGRFIRVAKYHSEKMCYSSVWRRTDVIHFYLYPDRRWDREHLIVCVVVVIACLFSFLPGSFRCQYWSWPLGCFTLSDPASHNGLCV